MAIFNSYVSLPEGIMVIWSQDNYDNYDNIPKTFTNFDFLMRAPSDSFQKDSMKWKNPSVLNCKLATKSCKLRSCSTSSVISSREQILCLFYLGTKHVFPWDVRRWAGTGWAIHRIGTSPVRDRALQVGEGWSSMEEQNHGPIGFINQKWFSSTFCKTPDVTGSIYVAWWQRVIF